MQIIAKLSEQIEEELGDAEKYIRCAIKQKEENPTLAAVYFKLSTEEMNHMSMLHEQVVALIAQYRKDHGDPPEKMQGIYEYVHRKHVEKANEIKVMQGLFKES